MGEKHTETRNGQYVYEDVYMFVHMTVLKKAHIICIMHTMSVKARACSCAATPYGSVGKHIFQNGTHTHTHTNI